MSKQDKAALRYLNAQGITNYAQKMHIIGTLKHDVPNLRLDNCKFVTAGLRMYYNDDLSLAEIAENVGITRQGVRDLIKRAEQTLISLEESCRYCERFLKLKELSAKARGGDKTAAESIFDIIDEL